MPRANSYLCPQGKILSYEGKEERHLQAELSLSRQEIGLRGMSDEEPVLSWAIE